MKPSVPETDSAAYQDLLGVLSEEASRHYIDLPYHNFAHAEHTRTVARGLVDLCLAHEVNVSPFVVEAAALLHDVDYHMPLPASIPSKERRSSRVAGRILKAHDIHPNTIRHVQAAILSTEVGVRCASPEAVIVRRADLDNLTDTYLEFLFNTHRLYREHVTLHPAESVSLANFLLQSTAVLNTYLAEDLRLGTFDREGFLDAALHSVSRLSRETATSFLRKITTRQVAS